jgi:hypothetical protein
MVWTNITLINKINYSPKNAKKRLHKRKRFSREKNMCLVLLAGVVITYALKLKQNGTSADLK